MKWIRTQDELPELKHINEAGNMKNSDDVLVYRDGEYHVAYLLEDVDADELIWVCPGLLVEIEIDRIQCWAPIAPPPKECLGDDVP